MDHNALLTVFFVILNFYLAISNPVTEADAVTCTKACHKLDDKKINVHLVPHSHDDVGWLKTYDEYYTGTGKFDNYEDAGVKYILDSTIKELTKNPDRRYIQVETAFFWKWWNDQTTKTRKSVIDLVNKGQLEMINGGWTMNDEAAANYQSIIDQFTWGFRILEDTVGQCGRPKIGWQIDPFGHSREHASLMTQLGFEGLVVGRIDFRDKAKRIADKNLDFIWNSNDNFAEEDAKIFTTMFPDFYVDVEGFCFDTTCDDEEITDANVKDRVTAFKVVLDGYKSYYKTKNIMLPMGRDFSYQKADKNFNNIDKLIKGFAQDADYNVIYSTPSCYIDAVKAEVDKNKIELIVKTDDFFPYASDVHQFWTGYFTSRPTSKRFERVGNNILQSVKQLTTFSRTKGTEDDKNILKLRMAMGMLQHHDAITGTEKQAVADDYSRALSAAIEEAEKPVSNIIRDLLKKRNNVTVDLKLSSCLLANVSICDTTRKDRFLVAVQNPLSKVVSHYVRLPVDGENYKITGPDGEEAHDIFDTMSTFDFITEGEKASKELVFLAKDLPALGIKLYYVEKVDGTPDAYHKFADITDQDVSFGTEGKNGFTLDADRKLETVIINGQQQNIKQDFYYYKGFADSTPSGAYIFRPDGAEVQVAKDLKTKQFAKGTLVDEVLQIFSDEVTQIIRVYKGDADAYVEFDWLVGNLKVDAEGKEVITRFTVQDLKNQEIFYTDANGRQQIQRKLNKRGDYEYTSSDEPVSSNYYPVTSKIVIKDETQKLEVAVLNDRAQGGSSLTEGVVELMIHRRDTKDDHFGVNEALNEQQYGKGLYARGQHYLTFGIQEDGKPSPAVFERHLAHKKLLAPLILVGDATGENLTLEKVQDQLNLKFEALKSPLPDNVQILTLEPWTDSYILRLEHIFEKNEDTDLSKDATVDLKDMFTLFNIVELTPTNLGANQDVETKGGAKHTKQKRDLEANKQLFNIKDKLQHLLTGFKAPEAAADPDLTVTLKPMEIKTFIFTTDKENKGGKENGITTKGDTNNSQALSSVAALVVFMTGFFMLI